MLFRNAAAVAAAGFIAFSFGAPANALTAKECSEKYKAAQEAKTLGNKSWNDFQRFECGADAKPTGATPAAAPAAPAPAAKAPATPPAAAPAATAPATPAVKGLTSAECSAKYKAAKAAGTLGDKKWNDFRKAECGAGATPAAAAAPSAAAPTAAAPTAPAAAGAPVFPTAISPKFASEKAGKARMHTCLDQYRANKATGGNGGLVWIGRKGGGYYSACNKKLKGQ